MDRSSKYYPIRRSTRLPLEIPLLVTSLSSKAKFLEDCATVVVNAHGCGITAPRPLDLGTRVSLEIPSTKQTTTARVVEVVQLDQDQRSWLLGLALDKPGNFWGIQYAPADWQAESPGDEKPVPNFEAVGNAPHRVAQGVAETVSSGSPAVRIPARCRLTAISPGACYVQSDTTFPRLTHVTVRVLITSVEHSFMGTVRVEHPQSGMGIEFDARDRDHGNRARNLIRDLGARENLAPQVQVDPQTCRGSGSQKAESTVTPELHDNLLALILVGTALTREDFLRELERQRRSKH
jgi:PilZ domain